MEKIKYIEELETFCKKSPKLKIEGIEKNDIGNNQKQFILDFFKEYNCERTTLFIRSNKEKCDINKYRSIHDIYNLCRYYFPNTNMKSILTDLFQLCKEKRIAGRWFCHIVRKYVFDGYVNSYCYSSLPNYRVSSRLGHIDIKDLYEEVGFKESDFNK